MTTVSLTVRTDSANKRRIEALLAAEGFANLHAYLTARLLGGALKDYDRKVDRAAAKYREWLRSGFSAADALDEAYRVLYHEEGLVKSDQVERDLSARLAR